MLVRGAPAPPLCTVCTVYFVVRKTILKNSRHFYCVDLQIVQPACRNRCDGHAWQYIVPQKENYVILRASMHALDPF